MVTTLRLQWIVNSIFRPTWLLDESDRGGVAMNDEELKTEIREDGAKLNRLEREEQEIESSDHHGFRDAESRIRLEGEIASLDDELKREQQRVANEHG
jgi:hypothetical protein